MKQYFCIGLLASIFVTLVIKYAVTERANEYRPKNEDVREYIHQMAFDNGVRSRTLNWNMLPIPIYLDLHNADTRSMIENTMRSIEYNVGVPLFLETYDFRQAQIFLITSQKGQERLPDFFTRFLLEVIGPPWLELFQNKAPEMFDAKSYPQPPSHPCFIQEFFSDPATQFGSNRKPTQMQVFVGGVAEIERDLLNECLTEKLLQASFFLRDADLTHGKHSIFNRSSHPDKARVPTPFDLCLISELLKSSFEATDLDQVASSIYQRMTNRECPVWQERHY